jgi:3D (Asp-Asp-Asp) domain-containing protein
MTVILLAITMIHTSSGQQGMRRQVESFTVPPISKHAIAIWATNYYVYSASAAEKGIPLLDIDGKQLGPFLTSRDWCLGGIEGTVMIGGTTYNFAGEGNSKQVDCKNVVKVNVGNIRYRKARGPFGDGTAGFALVPYRTIATDPDVIPTGTVVFIPAAVGEKLPNGLRHDGYFFAADVGSKIKGGHIDVFTGTSQAAVFQFVTSDSDHRVDAYVVEDKAIIGAFRDLHKTWIFEK